MKDCDSDPTKALETHVAELVAKAVQAFEAERLCVSKGCLEKMSAESNPGHPAQREGSQVYVAYSGCCPLYAGETGVSVRARFRGHGHGAHNRKSWYDDVTHVRFLPLSCGHKYYRQLVEAALVIALRPREQAGS